MGGKNIAAVTKSPSEWKAEREKAYPGWSKLETDDFQNRGDRYPKSNAPDSIEHQNAGASFMFKNTDETTAAKFVKNYMARQGLEHGKITASQDGDYHDDWVQVFVEHPSIKQSKDLGGLISESEAIAFK